MLILVKCIIKKQIWILETNQKRTEQPHSIWIKFLSFQVKTTETGKRKQRRSQWCCLPLWSGAAGEWFGSPGLSQFFPVEKRRCSAATCLLRAACMLHTRTCEDAHEAVVKEPLSLLWLTSLAAADAELKHPALLAEELAAEVRQWFNRTCLRLSHIAPSEKWTQNDQTRLNFLVNQICVNTRTLSTLNQIISSSIYIYKN